MRITVEIKEFKKTDYDFTNDKGEHIQGTKYSAISANGFEFRFKTEEEYMKLQEYYNSEESIPCRLDKYSRLNIIEEE